MRFRTFLATGIEVLKLGGEKWESNPWPIEHWKQNSGRWRLATEAIDAHMSAELAGLQFGSTVEGFVLALEIADFSRWPNGVFAPPNTPPSYRRKHRDLWCFAQLNWVAIQFLGVEAQYERYCQCLTDAIGRVKSTRRMPRGFESEAFQASVTYALSRGVPSQFTRAAYYG